MSNTTTAVTIVVIVATMVVIWGGLFPNASLRNSSTANHESNAKIDGVSQYISSVAQPASNVTSGTGVSGNSNTTTKVVILSFDDNKEGDFTYAKPILDKYGFKATFFVICGKTGRGATNWQEIAAMQKDGMDIESHTMTHPHLNTLNQSQLDYQIAGSKQCLASHGYNSTIFAYPYNSGSNEPDVVRTVAKYYNIGRSGTEPLMFLDCNGFKRHPQTDCRTYGPEGKLNYANRYEARSLSFDVVEIKDSFNNTKIFSDFVKVVNSQSNYNHGGKINAVPLITLHNVELTTNEPYYTNVGLFDQLMKYLYDTHFKVLTFKQLGYNTQDNTFYLNDIS
ncbi:MAG: polysaccharide deacetylase family protein [Candidatus Nitrosopolaris sp.]